MVRPGDVLVRVRATGITPAELTWDETYQNADGTPRIPGIPGHEVSGVVEETAPDVTDFRAGDEIYGHAKSAIEIEDILRARCRREW